MQTGGEQEPSSLPLAEVIFNDDTEDKPEETTENSNPNENINENSNNLQNNPTNEPKIQNSIISPSSSISASQSLDIIASESGQSEEVDRCIDHVYDRSSLNYMITLFTKTAFPEIRAKIFSFFQKMILNPSLYIEYVRPSKHRRNSDEFSSTDIKPMFRHRSNSFKLERQDTPTEIKPETPKKKFSPLTLLFQSFPRILDKFSVSDIDQVGKNLQICIMKLVPDPRYINKVAMPELHYFQEACEAFRHVLNIKKTTLANHLVKALISASFAIIFSIVDSAKIKNQSQYDYINYIGEIISVISTGLGSVTNMKEISNMLTSFWVAIVLYSKGDFSIYFTWNVYLRRIAASAMPFSSVCSSINPKSIDSLINDVNIKSTHCRLYSNSEEMATALRTLIPELNFALVKQLEPMYGIFLLCIYSLEKYRAASGDLCTYFEYMDYSYNPIFDQCIDLLLEPIFNTYCHHVSAMSETIQKSESVFPTAKTLLRSFLCHGSRRSQGATCIYSRFFTRFVSAVLDNETWQIFMNMKGQISKDKMQNFLAFFNDLVKLTSQDVPTLLFSIFSTSAIREQDEARAMMFSYLYDNLQPHLRPFFSDYYAVFNMMKGMSYNFPDNLDQFDAITKARYITMQIIRDNDISKFDLIPYEIPTSEKVRLWSLIFCQNMKLAYDLVNVLAKRYIHGYMSTKGIFSTEYDLNDVRDQTAIFSFFTYLVKINCFTSKIIPQLYFLKDGLRLKHPGSVHCYMNLLYFIISVMQCRTAHEFETAGNSSNMIILLDVSCRVISLGRMTGILQYVTTSEVVNLRKIIPSIQSLANSNKTQFCIQNKVNPVLSINVDQTLLIKLSNVILYCLSQTLMYFSTYINPQDTHIIEQEYINTYWLKPRYYYFSELLPLLLTLCPSCVYSFIDILNTTDTFISDLPKLVKDYQRQISGEENLIHFIARYTPHIIDMDLKIDPQYALTLIQPELLANETISHFVTHWLHSLPEEDAMLMVPQLVQSIRFDKCKTMRSFLIDYAKDHEMFAHRLLWNIANEKGHPDNTDPKYARRLPKIEGLILNSFKTSVRQRQMNEFGLIEELDRISQRLKPYKIEERREVLINELKNLNLSNDLYVPSRPEYKIIGINAEESLPLKSHSRVPILVNFEVEDKENKRFPYGCIFKIQDDVRTDCLMIQLIDKFGVICRESGLDIYVCPYKVFSTGFDRGVIEVIQHAKSRHDIGMTYKSELLHYFTTKFGPIGTPKFNAAQDNFIKSLASYSLICYLFQVKDRHNANIMIDDEGHIIHIDFGFIFDISPGGNIKFERAPFKLTREYVNVLGGSTDAVPFQRFVTLFMRCFLAVQSRYIEIINIVELMKSAGLPCFTKNSIKSLKERFALTKNASELPDYIKGLVTSSLDSFYTSAYDSFQNSQNNIFYC